MELRHALNRPYCSRFGIWEKQEIGRKSISSLEEWGETKHYEIIVLSYLKGFYEEDGAEF